MSCTTADTTDDVGSVVTLLWAVVLAMSDIATVLADLILVITQGTVQSCEFTKLITFVIILSFRSGRGLYMIVNIVKEYI